MDWRNYGRDNMQSYVLHYTGLNSGYCPDNDGYFIGSFLRYILSPEREHLSKADNFVQHYMEPIIGADAPIRIVVPSQI